MTETLPKQEISIYKLMNTGEQNSKYVQQQQSTILKIPIGDPTPQRQLHEVEPTSVYADEHVSPIRIPTVWRTESFDAGSAKKNLLAATFLANYDSKLQQSENKESLNKGSIEKDDALPKNKESENTSRKSKRLSELDAGKILAKPVTKLVPVVRPSLKLKDVQDNSQKPLSTRGTSSQRVKDHSIRSVSKDKVLKNEININRLGKITTESGIQRTKQESSLIGSLAVKPINLKIIKTQVIHLKERKRGENLTEKSMNSTCNDISASKRELATPTSSSKNPLISESDTKKSISLPNIGESKVNSKAKNIDPQNIERQKSSVKSRVSISKQPISREQLDTSSQITPKRNSGIIETEYFERESCSSIASGLKISPTVKKESTKSEKSGESIVRSKKEGKSNQSPKSNTSTTKTINFTAAATAANLKTEQSSATDQSTQETAPYTLSEDELQMYGDRYPKGFIKIGFLGRGGCALVWLGIQEATGVKVAMKQIAVQNSSSGLMKEVIIGKMLFDSNQANKLGSYPGIDHIIKFISCVETSQDLWIVFELGGSTLGKCLFEIKGEFHKGERVYGVKNMNLYKMFQDNALYLKAFIRQMTEVLRLFSDLKLVHSDLKPDNILIQEKPALNGDPFTVKMIDFGSAFSMKDIGALAMATPEYMPPEVLRLITNNKSKLSAIEELARISPAWSVDVWSLGAIVLEILSGVPVWMSLRSKVEVKGKISITTGLFGVKGRCHEKIRVLQKNVVESLEKTIRKYLTNFKNSEGLFDLLGKMLQMDPKKRISPEDILNHTYLNESPEEVA